MTANANANPRDAAAVRQAWRAVSVAQSSLSLWLRSLPPDGFDAGDDVSVHQVTLRAIGELLEVALGQSHVAFGQGLELLYANGFVSMAESALWNFMNGSDNNPPSCEDLCANITQALAYLADLSSSPAGIGARTNGGAA